MIKDLVFSNKGFYHKDTNSINLRTSSSLWIISVNIEGRTSKIRSCPKNSTLPVKKLR